MGIKQLFSKTRLNKNKKQIEQDKELIIQETNVADLETLSQLTQLEIDRINQSGISCENFLKGQEIHPECGYVEWNPIQMKFFISVCIPGGYELTERNAYNLGVTIDRHFIKFIQAQQVKPATIHLKDEQEQDVDIEGLAKVYQTKISGLLVYNSLLNGFEAGQSMTDEKSAVFNQVGTIFVDRILGYVCGECPEGENPLQDYSITLVPSANVTVILPASQTVVKEGADEFFVLIEDSSVQRMIGKKYTLIISPSPEPVS